ncbi:GGDEF domain-containing response regulator [uncultured Roseibium sp.]|uniref:two-component system response regulator n=1 Tax=uncultured Roseibium sp. TaxID=1936171 RepID=UPI002628A238|nr:GGDEF domain-containing response regulator [uncultured Roseibium sp.]
MSGKAINVLIVDDDEDDIYLIVDTIGEIAESEYTLHVSHSPTKAIDIIKNNTIDIVLCDYLMGATSGLDLINSMRAENIETPVILLTGMGGRHLDDAALAAGAADFISKNSLAPEVIDRAVRYAIANAERQCVLQTVLTNVNAAVVLIDKDGALKLWNPMYTDLVESEIGCTEEASLKAFSSRILSENRIFPIGDRILERKITNLLNNEMVVMLQDVTEHVEALRERELANNRAEHLAMHCSLTNLPNRNAFNDRLNQEIARAKDQNSGFYLFLLDLNKFKEVNDFYGHQVGDALLSEVGRRMSACLKEGDYLARLGGDEFVAIQRWDEKRHASPELAHRIVEVVNGSYPLLGTIVNASISIGIATYPEHGKTAEELMSNADLAMYRAKENPVNPVSSFDADMDKVIRETRKLARDLKMAVELADLDVHFQPQANVSDSSIVGFEALARWNHAKLGAISPSRFIPIAEDTGLIHKVGELVLLKACEIASTWTRPLKVAVNISPLQIRYTDIDQIVHSVLLKTQLPASRLELEVTESVLIDDFDRAHHILRKLKNLGVSIALDDFGTGFASLSTLVSFPFDKIKIDRSFTSSIDKSAKAAEAMRAMIGLGQNLNHRVIVEGVEKPLHVDFLAKLNCDLMQGFLIGAPTPHHAFDDLTRPVGTIGATERRASPRRAKFSNCA